ncbi:MAG: tRNA uridine-5-carboxymethylaminomethyl(34) synthesis GTPase MnmE [Nitrospiraceae bacterium]|nr:MAG: tRNA uridine-5-carboxymethylaminomethyl(34) synthesis GTPase MnmE [Nitrospiraceae bacterium]
MHTEDTIAAISTPPGRGGIGIVRLSGGNAIKIAERIFISPKSKKLRQTASHRILYGHIANPKNREIIDEALVSVMKAPNTYTREDMVEINCHGGPAPLRRVLEIVLEKGARLAGPGEFTQRAFLNGRIDLAQAEAVLDVINALTEQGRRTAVEQLRGGLSARTEAVREKLADLAAVVETHIDFPEEDIGPAPLKDMNKRALRIQQALKKLTDSARYGMILREGLKTAIIGRPNVGKSSLLNALLEHDRAIVTEIPGTTRDVIEEYLNINGIPARIMDTAGIREVRDIAEREGVKRSIRAMEDADLVLLVLDGSEALHKTDLELAERSASKNTIFVINKTDLPRKINPKSGNVDLSPIVHISAKSGTGLEELKNKITESITAGNTGSGDALVTNVRHARALEKALASVGSFISALPKKTSPEFLSVELRDALDAVGEIAGTTTPDDILNRIFSNFCIGK